LRRPRNVTLHLKFSVQWMTKRENDMNSIFVLGGSKSAHFLSPLEFVSGPPREVGLMQIPDGHMAKILIANHFLFFKIISERPLSLTARFFTRFLPNNYYYSFPLLFLKDFICILRIHLFFLLHVSLKTGTICLFFDSFFLTCVYCNGRLLTRWGVLSISRTRLESKFTLDDLFLTPISTCFSSNACFKF
jgi:hypothetical protein